MAGTRVAFEATYTSGSGTNLYRFTIYVNVADVVSVRDIRTPYGLLIDSMTTLPQSVVTDIQTAMGQVETLLSLTSAVNGILSFSSETEKEVTFTTPMSNTNYRVHLSPSDFIPVRVTNKSTTGFTVQVGITFTGTVGYDVFV
jgi:hypothetical protein